MATQIFADLHVHSCLSPCAEDDMTPLNLVRMAKLSGISMLALTDHNSCANCRSAIAVGEEIGLTVIPGMELCTAEEIHCICLFETADTAENFSAHIRETLPRLQNRAEIFGNQYIMDEKDNIRGTESLLLTTASSIPISAVHALVERYGGICFPAHLDRASYSLLSVLGAPYKELGFTAAEFTKVADTERYMAVHPLLREMQIVRNSDAHSLEALATSEPQSLPLADCSFTALAEFITNQK